MSTTTLARRAAVLGAPIAHSLSPLLHRAAYEALGLEGWRYDPFEVTTEQLPSVLAQMDEMWAGLSLTMPLKQAVIPYLDHVEPLAELLGVVNTVMVQPVRPGLRPILVGTNTDVHGMVQAFRDAGVTSGVGNGGSDGVRPRGGRIHGAILGGGATAISALAALAQLGCSVPDVYVRSLGRSGPLVRAAAQLGLHPHWRKFDRAAECIDAELIISTVPAGGLDDLCDTLAEVSASPQGRLLDVVYHPWPSRLGQFWGDHAIAGTEMLLHQAGEQVRLMTGHLAPIDAMRTALYSELAGR